MIFLLHGDNYARSRATILKLQEKLPSTAKKELDISETSPEQLFAECATFDIFGVPPFVVLDISTTGTRKLDDHLKVLYRIPKETTLVLLSNKKLPATSIFLKKANDLSVKVQLSQTEPSLSVFSFIDSVFAKNRELAYKRLYALLMDENDPFYLFTMLVYGLRNIAYAKFNSPMLNSMAPFAKTKAQTQAREYTHTKLKLLYQDFYTLDKKAKDGGISKSLLIPMAIEKVLH